MRLNGNGIFLSAKGIIIELLRNYLSNQLIRREPESFIKEIKRTLLINWIVRGYRGVVFDIGAELINVALRQRRKRTFGMVQITNRHGFINLKRDRTDALSHFSRKDAR